MAHLINKREVTREMARSSQHGDHGPWQRQITQFTDEQVDGWCNWRHRIRPWTAV